MESDAANLIRDDLVPGVDQGVDVDAAWCAEREARLAEVRTGAVELTDC